MPCSGKSGASPIWPEHHRREQLYVETCQSPEVARIRVDEEHFACVLPGSGEERAHAVGGVVRRLPLGEQSDERLHLLGLHRQQAVQARAKWSQQRRKERPEPFLGVAQPRAGRTRQLAAHRPSEHACGAEHEQPASAAQIVAVARCGSRASSRSSSGMKPTANGIYARVELPEKSTLRDVDRAIPPRGPQQRAVGTLVEGHAEPRHVHDENSE